jgi:hypothetical protein
MEISGTVGIKNVVATIHPEGVEITHKQQVLHNITMLWMVGFQRVSKHLKMCDVVWLDGATQTPIIQSVPQSMVDTIVNNVACDVVMLGMDPPPWSKLSSTARKHGWQKEDWLHVFSEDPEESSDDEWLPGESSDDSESETEEVELWSTTTIGNST